MQEILNYHKQCGARLKKIRESFNEGRKLSADQFAHILNETRDKIANYESGRSQIPIRVLYELFLRGYNPTFIITGDGDIFADSIMGKRIKKLIEAKAKIDKEAAKNYASLKKEMKHKAEFNDDVILKAAAGNFDTK